MLLQLVTTHFIVIILEANISKAAGRGVQENDSGCESVSGRPYVVEIYHKYSILQSSKLEHIPINDYHIRLLI